MSTRLVLAFLFLLLCPQMGYSSDAREPDPRPILQVIPLAPGERLDVTVALPFGEFRAAGNSGRSSLSVEVFPEKRNGTFRRVDLSPPTDKEMFKAGPYPIAPGVTLRWSEDKLGLRFEAKPDATASQTDIRVTYANFGFEGVHTAGYRVIVSPRP